MNKTLLEKNLHRIFEETIEWLKAHDDQEFELTKRAGKWTTGQHIKHLIQSTTAVNQGLQIPKEMLAAQFGVLKREAMNYNQLVTKYTLKLAEGPVIAPKSFVPGAVQNEDKDQVIEALNQSKTHMISLLEKWNETQLSEHILPHPLIGKLTIREMIMFTIYHTEHHLQILKKYH